MTSLPQDQSAFWNGPAGQRWAEEQELFDLGIRELAVPALTAADVRPGEAVLDVGCGCGDSSLILADLVGPSGRVVGLDFSAPMLARAKERGKGRANLSFVFGDAAVHPLAPSSFDLLFSRFGVMFFPEPEAAFQNLVRALRPGGRVAFVCWRPLEENPWSKVPFDAVVSVAGPSAPTPPDAPGPFALRDPARVKRVLGAAGLVDIVTAPTGAMQTVGVKPTLEAAVDFAVKLGPSSRALREISDPALHARAVEAMRAALAAHLTPEGVRLASACWTVTARRPL